MAVLLKDCGFKKKNIARKRGQSQLKFKLADFVGGKLDGIPYRLMDYSELADWTGCAVREARLYF